ncbi:hypothetical protein [Enterococcus haemoperoxidus]|uniref:hypothetical protein n=1 Tax=Enterococcus haemoperoxidus TaxID=155618 RepID=UPI001FCCB306|nr:hypothetical protein [Enterococcus haemoperoxidus]
MAGWIIYLINFYLFYKEAYFYIDKRLSFFLQLLSLLNDNWTESIIYLVFGFLLMVWTMFSTYLFYLVNKKEQQHIVSVLLFLSLNILFFLSLLFNIVGLIYFVLMILALSLVYIIFVLAMNDFRKIDFYYEEGETIDTLGPFETEDKAKKEATSFIAQWQGKESVRLSGEIYLDTNNKYYTDIYIETIKKDCSIYFNKEKVNVK